MPDQPPPAAAAASAAAVTDDAAIARKLHAIEQLTELYGFDRSAAEQAVDAVLPDNNNEAAAAATEPIDVPACCNYILERNLGQDKGGPVTPIAHCPHIGRHCCITPNQLPLQPAQTVCRHVVTMAEAVSKKPTGGLKEDTTEVISGDGDSNAVVRCTGSENWLCLECGAIRCSRYVNGHGLQHWQETRAAESSASSSSEAAAVGHCLAVSLSDLSVWCHVCQAYLVTHFNPHLQPIVQTLEALKFSGMDSTGSTAVEMVQQRVPADGGPLQPAKEEENASDRMEEEPLKKKHKSDSEMDDDNDSSDTSASGGKKKDKATSEGKPEAGEGARASGGDADADEEGPEEASVDLMELLASAAAAQGIPLEWLIRRAVGGVAEEEQEDEEIDYPFDAPPKSLEDVANFIKSEKCKSIVVLAGAGMSVASGIPDFRSADGLYATLNPDLLTASESERDAIRLDPTVALDQQLFLQNPLPMLELQREFILGTRAQRWKATLAHRFVELLHSKTGKLKRHYTQNIDGLEDQCYDLPRDKVIAVHGSMDRAECARCQSEADFNEFCDSVQEQIKDLSRQDPNAPNESSAIKCKTCGYTTMKPSIVLFRSSLPKTFFESVPNDIKDTDLLIIMGTSLRVAPANSLVWRAPKSAMRVLVNREEAGDHLGLLFDEEYATRDYFAQGEIEDVLLKLMDHLGWVDELEPLLQEDKLPESSAKLLQERLDNNIASSGDDDRKPAGENTSGKTDTTAM